MQPIAKLSFSLVMFLCVLSTRAQRVKGTVQDAAGTSLPFVNVVLHAASDSAIAGGAVSDTKGGFSISFPGAGNYFLKASAMGYLAATTPVFKLNREGRDRNFKLILTENRAILGEATVEALQARVVARHDRLVMKVGGTAMAAGSNGYELLKHAPGVWSDQNGELQINGKSGVKVLIDGRETYLSGDQLQSKLRNISAQEIEDIEIIHNPSSKYEAEGTAGIINIVLKKNKAGGLTASLYSDYRFSRFHFINSGTNISYRKKSFSAFANLSVGRDGRWRDMEWYREYNQPANKAIYSQKGTETRHEWQPALRTGFDWELGSSQSVGFVASLSQERATQDWNTTGQLVDTNHATDVDIESLNHLEESSFDQNYNFHYRIKLDTNGTKLTANFDYVRLSNRLENRFTNRYHFFNEGVNEEEILTNSNPYRYNIAAARLDFTKAMPAVGLTAEAGLKFSEVLSENSISFFEWQDGQKEMRPDMSNEFSFTEHIYAGYLNLDYKLSENLRIQAGLRQEYTASSGYSSTLEQSNQRNYLNFFPSLFVQQKWCADYQMAFSYTRRITRPRYGYLNPYVFYVDPYTSVRGNPYLRPQYTHAVQLNQTFRNYNLILGYDYTSDFLSEVPSIEVESKSTVINHGNIDQFRNFSASLVVPLQLGKKVSINNMLTAAYQNYQTVIGNDFYDNSQLFIMGRSSATIKLPGQVILETTLFANGPVAHGIYRLEGRAWVNAGLKRSFLNDQLDLSVNVKDVFRSHAVNGSVGLKDNKALIDQYQGLQSLNISLRYHFRKGDDYKGQQHKLEELNRAGG